MASPPIVQISELLEYHYIEFVQEPPDGLRCVICTSVLCNAKQTSCGCRACENCLNHYLKDGERPCPSKQPGCSDTRLVLGRDILHDYASNREISNLKINCPFKTCKIIDTIKNMLTHVGVCDHREIQYHECSLKYANNDWVDHHYNDSDLVRAISKTGEILSARRYGSKTESYTENITRSRAGEVSIYKNIPSPNRPFTWKISDFSFLKAYAELGGNESVTSDPFYTSEFGYKMCLEIYPAGYEYGRRRHLAVFFAIMRGDYDDLLSWPFKHKVTLSLLDQQNGGTNNHSFMYKPGAESACYQKPTSDCNIASGSHRFIAFADLIPSSIYCRKDTIFLKIRLY